MHERVQVSWHLHRLLRVLGPGLRTISSSAQKTLFARIVGQFRPTSELTVSMQGTGVVSHRAERVWGVTSLV